jgi:hypothetical protein
MTDKLAVVTTFSKAGFDQYARRMVETWLAHWPEAVDLCVYPDEPVDLPSAVNLSSLEDPIHAKVKFMAKWTGQKYRGGAPYNYRFDVVKFCHKPFCLWDFAKRNDAAREYRGFMWLDADTITHQRITPEALERMAPRDISLQFLGRSYKYTECGYLWFNTTIPEARQVLDEWVRFYKTGQFRQQTEWHDSFLFDLARKKVPLRSARDLTGHIPRRAGGGHPFVNSFLGQYMDHHKGASRKATGAPRKNDLVTDHSAPYWKDHPHAKAR